ncbi:hypothetical protein PanWU01x14_242640 [Parasponia andersonii]|uniref:Uncharacterized protein n=1 Tax=Parasponia andersonii TaxID=3476 RepID=A0A2P5BFT4_PARAD|nr:hypothetical protein PanWU01x14_242640 [Parasponia andersonii]
MPMPETIVSVLQTFGRVLKDEIINRMDVLNPQMKPPVSVASTTFFFHSKAFSLSFIPSSPLRALQLGHACIIVDLHSNPPSCASILICDMAAFC